MFDAVIDFLNRPLPSWFLFLITFFVIFKFIMIKRLFETILSSIKTINSTDKIQNKILKEHDIFISAFVEFLREETGMTPENWKQEQKETEAENVE